MSNSNLVWWLVEKYRETVFPVTVVKFTDKTVTYLKKNFDGSFREGRSSRSSSYYDYFPSFQEAKDFLIKRERDKIANALYCREKSERVIAAVLNMEEPKCK